MRRPTCSRDPTQSAEEMQSDLEWLRLDTCSFRVLPHQSTTVLAATTSETVIDTATHHLQRLEIPQPAEHHADPIEQFLRRWQTQDEDPEYSVATSAISALLGVMRESTSSSITELKCELKQATDRLKGLDRGLHRTCSPLACTKLQQSSSGSIEIESACDLFIRSVDRTAARSSQQFGDLRELLIEQAQSFVNHQPACSWQLVRLQV